MLEVVAAFARWLQLTANFILLGSYICLIIAKGGTGNIASNYKSWMEKLERLLPCFAIFIPLGLMVVMASTIVQITGNVSNLFQPDQWISITTDTRAGQIWIFRVGISLLLLILIFAFNKIQKTVYHYSFCNCCIVAFDSQHICQSYGFRGAVINDHFTLCHSCGTSSSMVRCFAGIIVVNV